MSDTPKRWAEYIQYVKDTNIKAEQDADKWYAAAVKEYNARPWYKKMFTGSDNPWLDVERNMRQYHTEVEVSLTNYYTWDALTSLQ